MIKVGHDDGEAIAFLAEQVVRLDTHIVKGDICSACGRGVCSLDDLGLDTLNAWNQQCRNTIWPSLDGRGEVV